MIFFIFFSIAAVYRRPWEPAPVETRRVEVVISR
jgi:hypothetical protein